MDEISTQEVEKHRRGPKPQARKKMLISMTAADYDEFSMWADEAGTTKAMLMHDIMEHERERRTVRKQFGLEPSMHAAYEESNQWGGII